MPLEVLLTGSAVRNLEDIYDYSSEHDDSGRAARVLERVEAAIERLVTDPGRGSCPKELQALGIREYRQAFFKPYRMIYGVMDRRVFVYLIADGRRDMQTLLARRLFEA